VKIIAAGLLAAAITCLPAGCGPAVDVELINVSYDPTRELYEELNEAFARHYRLRTGKSVRITQSHGGSGAQARAVIDGLQADVVTLALAADIDTIAARGLIDAEWQGRLGNNSCPYVSTIVLVVRAGNPKGIRDWDDLVRSDVKVVTPNPKTSGGARWNFLAAWAYARRQPGWGDAEAEDFVRRLYANVPKLDGSARGAAETFVRRRQGDVLIAWESEALLIVRAMPSRGFQVIYPSVSILAEPPVALVDRAVNERDTRAAAQAYLEFLYSDEAQEIIGKHGYRPTSAKHLEKYATVFPALNYCTLAEVAGNWQNAQEKFFRHGGVFDRIYRRP